MHTQPPLVSVVPTNTEHRVHGQRTSSFPSVTVDILSTRKIALTEWNLRRYADPYWRLYLPLAPGGIVETDGKSTPLHPDNLYLIPPHTIFSTQLEQPFSKWYAHFKLGQKADRAAAGIYTSKRTPHIDTLLHQLEHPTDALFPWHTLEIVTQALRHLPNSTWTTRLLDPRIANALNFMSDHYALKLTAQQIAKHSGVSVRNLNHLFTKTLQQSPMTILLGYRLDEACRRLRNTTESIESIAEDCGLSNRHYFSRMLRDYRNTSPAAYRAEQLWG